MGKYIAAHSFLRFELNADSPLQLVAEMPDLAKLESLRSMSPDEALAKLPNEMNGDGTRLYNVVMSGEAQWTQQDSKKAYDLLRGKRGAYIQIVRFESMEVRLEDAILEKHPIDQFEITLADGVGDRVLNEALSESESDGISRLYDTFWFNCTTKAFDIIGKILGPDPRLGYIRSFVERRIPTVASFKVRAFGGMPVVHLRDVMDVGSLAAETALARERTGTRANSKP